MRRLYHEPTQTLLPKLREEGLRLDAIITDVPFNTKTKRTSPSGENMYVDYMGDDHYLAWMYELLIGYSSLLKPTGSVFIHCDHRSVYDIKPLMDQVFGRNCFVNDIIWGFHSGGASKRRLARKHHNIFWYSKTPDGHKFNIQREPYRASGTTSEGEDGHMYRQIAGKEVKFHKDGKVMRDVWDDISILSTTHSERVDYPDQKPQALIDRIINMSTDEGDFVGDFCCGSGTVGASAESLGRGWVLADANVDAVKICEKRLNIDRE